jgi:hypothetical protein
VIMMTLMPAVLQSWIEALTSGRTGSLMQTYPRNEHPDSNLAYLSVFESSSDAFYCVMFFISPPSSAIATARTLRPFDATF